MAFYFFCVISMFSAQDAERSTVESETFVEEGFRILEDAGFSVKNAQGSGQDVSKANKRVFRRVHIFARDAAHFGNFMILGFLYIMLVSSFEYKTNASMLFISIAACLAAAAIDELHQHFVPGRGSQIIDVLIDFNGSCFGCMIFVFSKLQYRIKKIFC